MMKRKFTILSAAIALLACLAVPMGMRGQTRTETTVSWTATSGALGTGIGSGTISTGTFSWSYSRTLISGVSYTGWTGGTTNCIQLGKNGGVENVTFSTSAIPGTIKSVSVECASYNNAHKVSITVGGTTYLASTATPKWETVNAMSGTGSSSGTIVISFTDGTRALYIRSITVVYEESSNPTYTVAQYSLPTNAHGTISFSPSASVEAGTEVTLMATPADGYDFVANSWVFYKEGDEDFEVDESISVDNNKFQMPAYDLWVDATFTAKPTYDITCVSTMEEVASLFATPESAYEGQTVTLSYLAEPGYFVESIAITKTSDGTATGITPTASGETYTFTMPAYEVTATATIAEKVATFTNGVYTETLGTQESFDNMTSSSVQGDNEWFFESDYSCATIDGGATIGDEDWLISPKMAVDNGKLNLSFQIWHDDDDLLTLKWSTTNSVDGDWTDLEFDEGELEEWTNVSNVEITTDASHVYVAFVYDNTDKGTVSEYSIKNFVARQYYNVTFNANNASATGTMAALSCAAGVATALTANSFAVAGKAFTGWNTQADGQGTVYSDEANITITANTTLYAQWADAYTVSFTTNGIADGTKQVVQGQAIGTLPEATAAYIPAGYTFMGWYNGEDITEPTQTKPDFIEPTDAVTSDLTLKAVFAEVSGSSSTGTLTETEITTNLTNTTCSYGKEKTYVDSGDNITWVVSCYTQSNSQKWLQLKNDETAYIKVIASSNITSVGVTISGASNNSGGANVITENAVFSTTGTIYLNTNAGTATNATHVGSTSGANVSNYFATIDPEGNNSTLYIQTNPGSRIWGITVTYGSVSYSNYRTSYTQSCTLTINGYGSSTTGGWYLIASPVAGYITPSSDNGFITDDFGSSIPEGESGTYDLYYFDQTGGTNGKEWKNYRQHTFNLESGKGYLYASKEDTDLIFTGTAYNGNGVVNLTYSESTSIDDNMRGWNLIGNPFGTTANLPSGLSYYTLNESRTELTPGSATTIGAMKAIFVQATATDQSVAFTKQTRNAGSNAILSLDLSSINNGLIDRAIVRFDEGNALPKFMLNPNNTKVFIPVESKDYAVVRHEAQGEMPVNFKAAEDGTYTITVNPEGMEMNYLHLIDNMTGNDIDLLCTPSYSFNATTNDFESRFRLVFAGASTGSATDESFAFMSDGNWIINNASEATLQVIDLNGRILSSERVNGSVSKTINATPGVYMLRLINGENVMVQKIVVR